MEQSPYCRMPWHEAHNLEGAMESLHLSMIYIKYYEYVWVHKKLWIQETTMINYIV